MTNTISPSDALAMIKSGDAILIDVREADEFKSEHIAYAISIPLSSIEAGFEMLDIPENTTILFQCLKGARGQMACERIDGACKNKILNITGGIEAWKTAKFPVINSGNSAGIPLIRQVHIAVGLLITVSVIVGFLGGEIGFILAGIFGMALLFAGITGWCGMAMLLAKMPWNK